MFATARKNLLVLAALLVLTVLAGGAHAATCVGNGIPDECDIDCGPHDGV